MCALAGWLAGCLTQQRINQFDTAVTRSFISFPSQPYDRVLAPIYLWAPGFRRRRRPSLGSLSYNHHLLSISTASGVAEFNTTDLIWNVSRHGNKHNLRVNTGRRIGGESPPRVISVARRGLGHHQRITGIGATPFIFHVLAVVDTM